ncbi:MAG TPA: carnitine 3-dehydrogenase, partial [Solirubrobacteraceae bacterium]|nr:carnitine 3-dehydrogenase [Solirubrobacteraceae bacterium]
MAEKPRAVALLGGGVIGGGWAARLLLNGVDVRLYDPDERARPRIAEILAGARRAYGRLTLVPLPPEGRMTFAASLEEAVAGADLVQESVPERVELKQRLLAAASQAAPPETLICSSTSGLRPSLLQAQMRHPERMLVAHPFNPVYLVPLVELCGGDRTSPDSVARADATYRALGMHPVALRHEIDGFLADRLLEALWREALWLVHDDVATVEEVDDVVRYGAGLRWAFMGTFLTYRIAGGEGGLRYFLKHFGPALQLPWTKLVDVPELSEDFLDKLGMQSEAQAGERSVGELERTRDDCLVALLQALRAQGVGAGKTLADWERDLLQAPDREAHPTEVPLRLVRREIPPDWIDYNGHVHESRYLQLFADASDALLRLVGVDGDYLEHGSYYTVETHLSHLGQLVAGDRVSVTTQLLDCDEKRLHLYHCLIRGEDPVPVATAEQMLLHVDP